MTVPANYGTEYSYETPKTGTRAMISDLKSESHLHLATIERHGHHIKKCSHKGLYSC